LVFTAYLEGDTIEETFDISKEVDISRNLGSLYMPP
jgi:hypothetical protein